MRVLLELVPLLVLVGLVWLVWQRSGLSARERTELTNLRAFKDQVRDAALTELELDSTTPLARIVLDEVRAVDGANSLRKDR